MAMQFMDIVPWLQRKYANMDAATQADATRANAQATLSYAQAAEIPDNAIAQRGLMKAQADGAMQDALLSTTKRGLMPQESAAQVRRTNSAAGQDEAQTDILQLQGMGLRRTGRIATAEDYAARGLTPRVTQSVIDQRVAVPDPLAPRPVQPVSPVGMLPASLFSTDPMDPRNQRYGFAKGTARVPGKGDGTVDTVPAQLAPGEAVLNKAAAETMGRGLIAVLNKAGAQKMGMV